mmetsp:Transcript_128630/g.274483  ORF Transcript_128630/g.274483 Transcript_128630/m.274483 type:complete len:230 (-) Transcript_128630:1381-2070(-)
MFVVLRRCLGCEHVGEGGAERYDGDGQSLLVDAHATTEEPGEVADQRGDYGDVEHRGAEQAPAAHPVGRGGDDGEAELPWEDDDVHDVVERSRALLGIVALLAIITDIHLESIPYLRKPGVEAEVEAVPVKAPLAHDAEGLEHGCFWVQGHGVDDFHREHAVHHAAIVVWIENRAARRLLEQQLELTVRLPRPLRQHKDTNILLILSIAKSQGALILFEVVAADTVEAR